MINRPYQAQEPFQRRGQFKRSPVPDVGFSQPPETLSSQPAQPWQQQKKRGKKQKAPLVPLQKQRKPRRKKV
jgi:hypothetical protein